MSASYMEVDFLIVTALPEETEAVRELLEEKRPSPPYVIGVISRNDTNAKYVVASTEIGEMGTNAAYKAVSDAIYRLNPKRVILTGIAAGFPETGVKLGDVLVPYFIFPYELAKIREAPGVGRIRNFLRRLLPKSRKVKYEPRADPMPVSESLWLAAKSLAKDEQSDWADAIREQRPDETEGSPAVHCSRRSVLGSGEKVVATKFAFCRQLLLNRFPERAIGLEMEAFGAQTACRERDIPFLVIKASQDPATRRKDKPAEKDVWRVYAAQAAATFTIVIINRGFEPRRSELLLEHMKQVLRYVQIFERDAPRPTFAYKVSRAESYALLKAGIYDLQSREPTVLIPNDAIPAVVLHGGGGTGKSRIVKSLIGPLIDEDEELCPVLVDLRKYRSEGRHGQNSRDPDTPVQDILLNCTVPRRTPDEMKRLAIEARLVVLIDGLNEVSRETRTALVEYFRRMDGELTCYLLVTDRFGPIEPLETFSHAIVERLDYKRGGDSIR